MKTRSIETEVFHEDGGKDRQTDMTKLIVTFHNCENAPRNFFLYVFMFYLMKLSEVLDVGDD